MTTLRDATMLLHNAYPQSGHGMEAFEIALVLF